jgi:hypothetical protein
MLAFATNAASSVPVVAQMPPPEPMILEKHEIPVHNNTDKWVWMEAERHNLIFSNVVVRYWCLAPGEKKTEVITLNVKDNIRGLRFMVTAKTKCDRPVLWEHTLERESWMKYTVSEKGASYAVTAQRK